MRRLSLLLAMTLIVGGCSDGDESKAQSSLCDRVKAEGPLPNRVLLRCAGPSLAHIETEMSFGTGIVVADGFVVTNAHVVDPFAEVDVTIAGKTTKDVPVKGIDAFADIALVGPVDTESPPLTMAVEPQVSKGDPVFLIGFPGELASDSEVTISEGVLSRTRNVDEFDLTYLQTDADIGTGQSGGALIDSRGRVLGVSGLAFAEEFALALSAEDTVKSINAIKAGNGDDYVSLPSKGDRTSGTFRLASYEDLNAPSYDSLFIPPSDEDRTLQLQLSSDEKLGVEGGLLNGDGLFINPAGLEDYTGVEDLPNPDNDPEPPDPDDFGYEEIVEPTAPGLYELFIPKDEYVIIGLTNLKDEPVEISYTTSFEVAAYDDTDGTVAIDVGASHKGVFDAFEAKDLYSLELEKGDEVTIRATTVAGDPAIVVTAPGQTEEDGEESDDETGLYGYDPEVVYEAEVDGVHTIHLYSYDGTTVGYVLEVERGDTSDDDEEDEEDEEQEEDDDG